MNKSTNNLFEDEVISSNITKFVSNLQLNILIQKAMKAEGSKGMLQILDLYYQQMIALYKILINFVEIT